MDGFYIKITFNLKRLQIIIRRKYSYNFTQNGNQRFLMKTRNQRGREGQTKTHGGEQGNTVEQTQLSGLRVRCQRAERFQSLSNDTSENKPVSIQHSSTEENGALKGL